MSQHKTIVSRKVISDMTSMASTSGANANEVSNREGNGMSNMNNIHEGNGIHEGNVHEGSGHEGSNTYESNDTPSTNNPTSNNNNVVDTATRYKEVLKNPLSLTIPTQLQPTEILAQRFASWRNIIASIIVYLKESCSIQDEIVRQHLRLSNCINFPFNTRVESAAYISNLNTPSSSTNGHSAAHDKKHSGVGNPNSEDYIQLGRLFAPYGSGSVQDLPYVLTQYHQAMCSTAQYASRELSSVLIPRLDDLRRDLLVKIKEIKDLQSDFKNSCLKEVSTTKKFLQDFQNSIEQVKYNSNYNKDPFLEKLQLNKQIKKQLHEENFLHEAFINLQTSGRELEKVVVMEIQTALQQYAKLMGQESQLVFDTLINKLDNGFITKDPNFEWGFYVDDSINKNCFIPMDLPMRQYSKIQYKNQFDPLTFEIQSGFLERRSRYLKSYSRGFYVLTANFLHEFKTGDRKKDIVPLMSLSLNDCSVEQHSKRNSQDYKFVLHAKQNGIINRTHNWVFKCDSYDTMFQWFDYLKKMTSTSDTKTRARLVTEILNFQNNTPKSPPQVKINPITSPTNAKISRQTIYEERQPTTLSRQHSLHSSTSKQPQHQSQQSQHLQQSTPYKPRTSIDTMSTAGSRHRYAQSKQSTGIDEELARHRTRETNGDNYNYSTNTSGRQDSKGGRLHSMTSGDSSSMGRSGFSTTTSSNVTVDEEEMGRDSLLQEHQDAQVMHHHHHRDLNHDLDLTPNTEIQGYEK
ncbi:hypothetical protein ACO0QE_001191 [Hanseniaspora vineae]